MKLKNGHIDTATMIRLLTRHRDWTASAPNTEAKYKTRARFIEAFGVEAVLEEVCRDDGKWYKCFNGTHRDDWTIHRPASERKKRERVELGELDLSTTTNVDAPDPTLPRGIALSDDLYAKLRRKGTRFKVIVEVIE
jgi:hypothetical protein